jgi:hypothetical protein
MATKVWVQARDIAAGEQLAKTVTERPDGDEIDRNVG